MATIVTTLTATVYLVLHPFRGLRKLMELTKVPMGFKTYIIGMGVVYFILAWVCEKHAFLPLAKYIGKVKLAMSKKPKKRKEFKEIEQRIRGDL